MNTISRTRKLLAVAVAVVSLTAASTAAQDIPRKSVTLVVGFAAGGAADTAARVVAKKLGDNLGLTVVVDNRAGAGGNLAHQFVAHATPDGSTILLGSIGPLVIAPHLMKLGYDPARDLAPLTLGMAFPNVLLVHAGVGVKTLAEFVALAKKKPGVLDFASTGAGSAAHLAGELFNLRAGIDTVHIPYKGGAPALHDLLGGRVAAFYSAASIAQQHIDTGKLIALATTGLQRTAALPRVATIAESGYPGFAATNWYAFMAPGKTPAALLDRWNQELVKALNAPEVQAELNKHGLTPLPGSRDELAQFMAAESVTWGKVIRERKITAE